MADYLRADDFQPDDDPAAQLAGRRESRIRNAVHDALDTLSGVFATATVADLIARNDVYGLLQILRHPDIAAALSGSYNPIAETELDAAQAASNDNFGTLIIFDPLQASAALMQRRADYVTQILNQARSVMQDTLLNGLRRGANPDRIAAQLQNVISLTPRQAKSVTNFRTLLENSDVAALNRALRDARFDGTIQRAIAGVSSLSPEQIDRMVERYAGRQLAFRAQTIARTESMRAATSGIRDAYVQAVQSEKLLDSEVRRFWLLVPDERLCAICASVPLLNPNGVGVNEPYQSIEGPIMGVGPHPRCRCSEKYTADLTRLSSQPFAMAA